MRYFINLIILVFICLNLFIPVVYADDLKYKGSFENYSWWIDESEDQVIVEFSTIYHHDKNGKKYDSFWSESEVKGEYYCGYNVFGAFVDSAGDVWIDCEGDLGLWMVTPSISGIDLVFDKVKIIDDLFNPYYKNNMLEFDYGEVKRYLRVIEGSIRNYWVIDNCLSGDFRIDVDSNMVMRQGVAVDAEGNILDIENIDGVEFLSLDVLSAVDYYPVIVNDSPDTFNPDADNEDGWSYCYLDNTAWLTIVDNAGTTAFDGLTYFKVGSLRTGSASLYSACQRGSINFDTGDLPDSANVTSVELWIHGESKSYGVACANFVVGVVQGNPDDVTVVQASDYGNVGDVVLSDNITYADWDDADWNVFTLNSLGLDVINLEGVTSLSTREFYYDLGRVSPPSAPLSAETRVNGYAREQGVGFEPKLIVTYELPVAPDSPEDFEVNRVSIDTVTANWSLADGATLYDLEVSGDMDDWYHFYVVGSSVNVTGLDLDFNQYFFRVSASNDAGESGYTEILSEGGEALLTIVENYAPMVICFCFLFLSFFIKSLLIYLSVMVMSLMVIFNENWNDTYIHYAFIFVLFLAIAGCIQLWRERGYD